MLVPQAHTYIHTSIGFRVGINCVHQHWHVCPPTTDIEPIHRMTQYARYAGVSTHVHTCTCVWTARRIAPGSVINLRAQQPPLKQLDLIKLTAAH